MKNETIFNCKMDSRWAFNQLILPGSTQLQCSPPTKRESEWEAVSSALSFLLRHSKQKVQGFCWKTNKATKTSQWVCVLGSPMTSSPLPVLRLWEQADRDPLTARSSSSEHGHPLTAVSPQTLCAKPNISARLFSIF